MFRKWYQIAVLVLLVLILVAVVFIACFMSKKQVVEIERSNQEATWENLQIEEQDDDVVLYYPIKLGQIDYVAVKANNVMVENGIQLCSDENGVIAIKSDSAISPIAIGTGEKRTPYSIDKGDVAKEGSFYHSHNLYSVDYVLIPVDDDISFNQIGGGYEIYCVCDGEKIVIGTMSVKTHDIIIEDESFLLNIST